MSEIFRKIVNKGKVVPVYFPKPHQVGNLCKAETLCFFNMKYTKRKNNPVLYQAQCNGGTGNMHVDTCFHNLHNNPVASSSVSIAQAT